MASSFELLIVFLAINIDWIQIYESRQERLIAAFGLIQLTNLTSLSKKNLKNFFN